MMIIRWTANFSTPCGWGEAAVRALLALDHAGCEFLAADLAGDGQPVPPHFPPRIASRFQADRAFDVNVVHFDPLHFARHKRPHVPNLGYTTFEADRIPAAWVPLCNAMDGLMVTSHFTAEAFRRSGVTVPVEIVPNWIDARQIRRAAALPLANYPALVGLEDCFRFYSIFDWTPRKNPEGLLAAFHAAFAGRGDVALVLRASMGDRPGAAQRAHMQAAIDRYSRDCRIVWLAERLAPAQRDALHHWGDCFVLPHRGEGFGLPLLEAMAAGKPVIGTGYSGCMDFMTRQNAYLIDFDSADPLDSIDAFPFWKAPYWQHPFDRTMRWAEPRVEHLAYLMRAVVTHPEEATLKARRAADTARGYDYRLGGPAILEAVRRLVGAHPEPLLPQRLLADSAMHAPKSPASAAPPVLPRNPSSAAEAAGRFLETVAPYPTRFRGRGIVTCAGTIRYYTSAWVLIRMLRRLGCTLPIQLWYLGAEERDADWLALAAEQGVDCVDASFVARRYPHRRLGGWELKPYAMLHSPFREVLLLDADNVPVADPTYLFHDPEYLRTGAVFWPDGYRTPPESPRWEAFGVPYRDEPEVESGQVLVDKQACWRALNLCNWYNEHSDYFYTLVYGDKDTFRFAWHRAERQFAMPERAPEVIPHTLCQHDLQGRRLFQHRCGAKWSLGANRRVPGFLHEDACLAELEDLARRWKPFQSHVRRLPHEDRKQMRDLAGRRYVFIQPGHSRRVVELGSDGLLAEGRSVHRWVWWIEQGRLVLAGDDGMPTCRLVASGNGSWEGRHLGRTRRLWRLLPTA